MVAAIHKIFNYVNTYVLMPVDTFVKNPELIRTVEEADDILSRLAKYEQERSCKAGVLLLQTRGLGGHYSIKSEEEAREQLAKPVTDQTAEWGVKFWPKDFFETPREKLISQ